MVEEWRPIKGYEGLYEVSSLGRVKSLNYGRSKGVIKELSLGATSSGYYQATLCRQGGKPRRFLVHRLVAKAFIENPLELPEVNHIDENPSNNCVDNLEWCTRSQNINHGSRNTKAGASISKALSKPIEAVDPVSGEVVHRFSNSREAQRSGFNRGNISNCCRGILKTSQGFIWRYI